MSVNHSLIEQWLAVEEGSRCQVQPGPNQVLCAGHLALKDDGRYFDIAIVGLEEFRPLAAYEANDVCYYEASHADAYMDRQARLIADLRAHNAKLFESRNRWYELAQRATNEVTNMRARASGSPL
jgi:hypothetical protein